MSICICLKLMFSSRSIATPPPILLVLFHVIELYPGHSGLLSPLSHVSLRIIMSSVLVLMKVFLGYLRDLGFQSMIFSGCIISSVCVVVLSSVQLVLVVCFLVFCVFGVLSG